jgi:hypothetical protein
MRIISTDPAGKAAGDWIGSDRCRLAVVATTARFLGSRTGLGFVGYMGLKMLDLTGGTGVTWLEGRNVIKDDEQRYAVCLRHYYYETPTDQGIYT